MRCEICGQDPCQTEGFCRFCRENDRDPEVIAERQRAGAELPRYWESIDVGNLWEALNDRRRFADAPNATYDALVWSLIHNNGWHEPSRRLANKRRIAQLSPRQFHELIAALKRKNCDPALIAEIESYA